MHDAKVAPGSAAAPPPLLGRLVFHCLPVRRRIVLDNLRRVFGDRLDERGVRLLAQAHYAHLARSLWEIVADTWRTPAASERQLRIENGAAAVHAHRRGKGVLLLTAHCGNWEVAAPRGMARLPEADARVHFVRRPLPRWLDGVITGRFRRAGIGIVPKKGSLDRILAALAAGDAVVFPLDQYALGRDGVEVEFFGIRTGTFRSLAIIARASGAPVVPVTTWRDTEGGHVVRFEDALVPIDVGDPDEWVRVNTRAYNAVLERFVLAHPEQWFWIHRRWRETGDGRRETGAG
jgi:KDO2-lipid IV(A) lauroyltransferase